MTTDGQWSRRVFFWDGTRTNQQHEECAKWSHDWQWESENEGRERCAEDRELGELLVRQAPHHDTPGLLLVVRVFEVRLSGQVRYRGECKIGCVTGVSNR